MNTMRDEEPERRAVEDLLPWYAAGTLSRRDMRRVEDTLAHDPELARRYELVREELTGTVHLNETLGAPSIGAMEKLFANIDAEPGRRPIRSPSMVGRLSAFLASLSPRTLAWSASAALLVILLQTGLIGNVLLSRQAIGIYQTASTPSTTTEGAFALIRFAPEASAADITRLLEANNVSIADGPSAGGLYRIRAATAGVPKEQLAKIIGQLREDKAVSFIAPTE